MHAIKYLAGVAAKPLSLALLLALAGLLLYLSRRRRFAAWLFSSGAVVAYLGSTPLVANALLRPLERAYPPLQDNAQVAVPAIVVLDSIYSPRDGIPVTGAIDSEGVVRLVEGVRLWLRLDRGHVDHVRLVLSGGAPLGESGPAVGYTRLALDLGVPRTSIIALPDALDTAEEARNVVRALGAAPFLLVTSAYHMPRAMRLMRREGAHPIPAPTGQLLGTGAISWGTVLPSEEALRRSERALHEYMGIAAVSLRLD
jgi:uncharacterized SAM-binding protein YcdF (DUF218 family)